VLAVIALECGADRPHLMDVDQGEERPVASRDALEGRHVLTEHVHFQG